ncbi:MAG: hypothetical protein GX826_12980 [Gammaproteobacteria bacterium]|jgi:Tfp pilus assembly protein PilV|nr:hypothetical protein [Gammaproteobacteria bacterium]
MLIELAVAALVIGIGILALLGVAHIGERAATDTENETRAALFADEVFTTLRLYSDYVSVNTNHQGWLDFWTRVSKGEQIFPVANQTLKDETWKELDARGEPSIVCDGTGRNSIHTNVWYAADSTTDSTTDFAFQYRLMISRPVSDGAVPFLDHPETRFATNTVWATLHVWNGRFRRHPDAFTFYTHFTDHGGLP